MPTWTATANQPWIAVVGGGDSGTGFGHFSVGVTPPAGVVLAAGTIHGSITLSASNFELPDTVTLPVVVSVRPEEANAPPFGAFDTPVDGAMGLAGSVAVSGWALDDVAISRVDVYCNCLETVDRPRFACVSPASAEPANWVFLGRAALIAGARPDVEARFPDYPLANRAGWGLLVLTNVLPHQANSTPVGGQGTFTLTAYAEGAGGARVGLGSKTVRLDNDHATTPFGAMDTPIQGATVPESIAPFNNPSAYPNFGWVLTRIPDPASQYRPTARRSSCSSMALPSERQLITTVAARLERHRRRVSCATTTSPRPFAAMARSSGIWTLGEDRSHCA